MSSRLERVLRAGQARSVATGVYDQADLASYVQHSAMQRAELEALKKEHGELLEQLQHYEQNQDCQAGLKARLAKQQAELQRRRVIYQREVAWFNQISHTLSNEDWQAAEAAQHALITELDKMSAEIDVLRSLITR